MKFRSRGSNFYLTTCYSPVRVIIPANTSKKKDREREREEREREGLNFSINPFNGAVLDQIAFQRRNCIYQLFSKNTIGLFLQDFVTLKSNTRSDWLNRMI